IDVRWIHRAVARRWIEQASAVPLWIIIAACCLLPLGGLTWQIVTHSEALAALKLTGFRGRLLERTLLYNGAVAAIAMLLALPAALVIGRGRGMLARILAFLLPLPLLLPSITYAYGWSQVIRVTDLWLRTRFPTLS